MKGIIRICVFLCFLSFTRSLVHSLHQIEFGVGQSCGMHREIKTVGGKITPLVGCSLRMHYGPEVFTPGKETMEW